MTKWFNQLNWYSISFWTISVYLSIANYIGYSIPERIFSFIASMAFLALIYFIGQWSAEREYELRQTADTEPQKETL